ncbi:MAG: glycoside hydrolase family 13 protein, partial [Candidatus Limivicinus sp.]|jgi:glycosidase
MDDYGFSMLDAYNVAAQCCDDLEARGIIVSEVYKYQARTANIINIMRSATAGIISAVHDSRLPQYRRPFGAARCGENVYLAFRLLGGRIKSAQLELRSDSVCRNFDMERHDKIYFVNFTAPETAQAMWYRFRIETAEGSYWLCPDESGYRGRLSREENAGFRLTVALRDFDTPAWFRRSVMYQIFPDRFAASDDDTAEKGVAYHRSLGQFAELHGSWDEPVRWQPREFEKDYCPDDFYGGTFKGIEKKLPYLRELGISCIYLNPITEARSNHRYDCSDYMQPDPILGTVADFRNLAAEAKRQGIRIILDGVFSHTGADSVYFNRYGNYPSVGACQGKKSSYYDWYDFKSFPDGYRCWWGFKDLPEVDEHKKSWQNFVIKGKNSVIKTWLARGASGWRLDVADELPDDVLALIRKSVKKSNPDAPVIGEVWEDAVIKESYGSRRNYALGYSLDSVMNYPFRNAAINFARNQMNAYGFRDFLIAQQMNYPKPMYYSLMNLLSSHDVDRIGSALAVNFNIRDLSREDQVKIEFSQEALDRALVLEKLCAIVQFSIPGVPSIYYGDEQGMRGVCDPFNRLPFKEGSQELHDYYVYLSNMRGGADALSAGEARFMAANADVLMILRYINSGRDAFGKKAENGAYLAVVNRGISECSFTADCREANCGVYNGSIGPCSGEIIRLR